MTWIIDLKNCAITYLDLPSARYSQDFGVDMFEFIVSRHIHR